jgi:3-oxoadipate enol-lactonase
MPLIDVNGVALHYELSGPEGAPVVAFSNSLGTTLEMWDALVPALRGRYRVLRYDTRGHGRSGVVDRPAEIWDLAADLAGLLEALGVARAHVVGLSLGGAVAQELALARPERVRSLALLSTFATQTPRSRALLEAWRSLYPVAIAEPRLRKAWELQAYSWLFTDRFWRSEANVRAALRFASSQPAQPVDGFVGQVDAALSHDARERLPNLNVPTLVIHGALDQLSPKENGEELSRLIPGAELLILADVGHAVNLEGQRAVNTALRALWKRVP